MKYLGKNSSKNIATYGRKKTNCSLKTKFSEQMEQYAIVLNDNS